MTAADVESSWAGLRPLIQQEGKSPSEISRRDEIFVSSSGLISIAGGKLTGYRKMAETVVDKVSELLVQEGKRKLPASGTKSIPMSGGDLGGSRNYEAYVRTKTGEGQRRGFSADEAAFLARRYGSNAPLLFELAETTKPWAAKHGLPLVLAVRLRYAIESEMTAKPADFLVRRTGDLFFRIAEVRKWKDAVIAAMAERLRWTEDQRAVYAADIERKLKEAVEPREAAAAEPVLAAE